MTDINNIIKKLEMIPHPEGGHYSETFRDKNEYFSHIFYLLKKGEKSHWHKLKKNENLNFYDGDPLKILLTKDEVNISEIILGRNLDDNQNYNFTVKADTWFSMCPLGEWSLIGCIVAPAFNFEDFQLAPQNWNPGKKI